MSAINIIFLILAILLLFWQVSLLIAVGGGAPTVYAKKSAIKKAFEAVNLRPSELVTDLGCGNARSLIIASQKFKAKGIGVEISPFYYLLAKVNVALHGQTKNVRIFFGNIKKPIREVEKSDVIFLYLFDKLLDKIEPSIFKFAKPHARIISLAFPFKHHEGKVVKDRPSIYIYEK